MSSESPLVSPPPSSGAATPGLETLSTWLMARGPAEVFRALGDSMPEAAVFAVDAERRVLYWSAGAERLLGFSAEYAVGEHCLKSNRCQSCMVGCGVSERDRVDGVPVSLYRADGELIHLRKFAVGLRDRSGGFAGGVEVLVPDRRPLAIEAEEERPGKVVEFHGLVTRDFGMRRAMDVVRNVAQTDVPVLVRGESGTGKELVARGVHQESHRRSGPFVAVNCAALPEALMESELFGHVRGAFTGAVRDRDGVFRQADGGTLFLDEVAELPLGLQPKLLRVLQEQTFVPVGGTRPVQVDVRMVSATHRSLRKMVAEGTFREDLMYRLRVVPLFLSPLRERRDDISLLLRRFIDERNGRGGRVIERVTPEAMQALLDHDWPGNVRELKNVVDYAFAVARGPDLALAELPPELRERRPAWEAPRLPGAVSPVAAPSAPPPPRGVSERERIMWALEQTDGHIGEAAELLGMSRPTFWRKRRRYGVQAGDGETG